MIQLNAYGLSTIQSAAAREGATTLAIYSGDIPTVDSSFVFNRANYEAQLLASFIVTYQGNVANVAKLSLGSNVAFDGLADGTASWFCLATASTVAGGGFILGTLSSDPATKAPLLIDNINITRSSGKPFSTVSLVINLS